MNQSDVLVSSGLRASEAKVYAALLELGESSVQEIAIKAKLQRPNCYTVLESLRDKGLVSLSVKERGRRYVAEDPAKLKLLARQKLEQLDEALPRLRSVFNAAPAKPKVRYFEGKENIKQLYDEVLEAGSYDGVYSPEFIEKEMGDYVEYFGRVVAKKKIKMREIITGPLLPDYYPKIFKSPLQQYRFMSPKENTYSEFMLYENKLALTSYRPNVHALIIEGSDIVQTMRIMFEELWKNASIKKPT